MPVRRYVMNERIRKRMLKSHGKLPTCKICGEEIKVGKETEIHARSASFRHEKCAARIGRQDEPTLNTDRILSDEPKI